MYMLYTLYDFIVRLKKKYETWNLGPPPPKCTPDSVPIAFTARCKCITATKQ